MYVYLKYMTSYAIWKFFMSIFFIKKVHRLEKCIKSYLFDYYAKLNNIIVNKNYENIFQL